MIPAQFQPVANHLWQSTLFAALAGLLTLALKNNRAAARCWIWQVASMKFLVPFSIPVEAGIRFGRHTVAQASQRGLSAAIEQIGRPFATVSPVAMPPLRPSSASWIPALLWAVWAIGFLALVSSWWRRWRSLRAAVRAASPLRLPIPIDAVTSPAFAEPCVFGIWRPILLAPAGIAGRLTPAQWQAILKHEHATSAAATIWPPRFIWRLRQCSGFTRWSGGWDPGCWTSASAPATKTC